MHNRVFLLQDTNKQEHNACLRVPFHLQNETNEGNKNDHNINPLWGTAKQLTWKPHRWRLQNHNMLHLFPWTSPWVPVVAKQIKIYCKICFSWVRDSYFFIKHQRKIDEWEKDSRTIDYFLERKKKTKQWNLTSNCGCSLLRNPI